MIENRFESIRKEISGTEWLCSQTKIDSEIDEENQTGIISGTMVFLDGSVFHFKEVLVGKKRRYRFHYMDRDDNLITRWDNAPHYRDLKTFPHHVHLPNAVKECEEMGFFVYGSHENDQGA
ncbi:MAG: toxin-antitoxin system TumE family protein [Thermodesulfobacteriota bacterium]